MGFIVKGIKKVVKAVVGVATKIVGGVFGFLVGGKKKPVAQPVNNLNKSLEPEASRKIVFGRMAAPLDTRFWEIYGAKGEYLAEVVALATHRIHSILELYIEQDQAISSAGAILGKYVGVLTRTSRLGTPGQTALTVGSGTLWTATSKFDGCAHMALTWKPDEQKLPNGVPSRYTQIVEGAPVYDPRRDSSVGGSGTHRIYDQSTWTYDTLDANGQPIGRNNALQALWYLIGWRIQNPTTFEWVLVAGRGVLPEDINMNTFIAGANACEIAGYYTDMVLATDDNHTSNEDKITCDGLIGRLIDPGGLWSYYANVDDTASIAVELTDADIADTGSVNWNEYKSMSDQYNQVVGKFINPSTITLFQAFPYPLVRDAQYETNLGTIKRRTQDFQQVLDNTLAQRLGRLKLNEGQYQGEFSAEFLPRAMKAQAYSVVRYASERFGWTKLFRVWRHDIVNGAVVMLLKEIHASIWLPGTVASAINPLAGIPYDPISQYSPESVAIGLVPMVGTSGTKADGFAIAWLPAPNTVKGSEVRYRLAGVVDWTNGGKYERDIVKVNVGPLLSGAIYEAQVRFISIHGIPGPWVFSTLPPCNASGQFQLGTTGNINYDAIAAAGGTAVWANVSGAGKPTDYADVTGVNTAKNILGQTSVATAPPTLVMNEYNPITNFNLIRFSMFERGANVGWAVSNPNGLSYAYGSAVAVGKAYIQANTIKFTGNGQYIGIHILTSTPFLGRVVAGQRLSVTTGMIVQPKPGFRWQFDCLFYKSDLTPATPSGINAAQGTNQVWFTDARQGGFVTVPNDAVYVGMILYMVNDSGGGTVAIPVQIDSLGFFEPMITVVPAGQTIHPPYSPGPSNEYGADVTYVISMSGDPVFRYSSTGVLEASETPRDFVFVLQSTTGPVTGAGITWTATWLGIEYGIAQTNGIATWVVTGGIPSNTVEGEVRAWVNGVKRAVIPYQWNRIYAPPPPTPPGGGGGGSGGSVVSKTSGFISISSTTVTDITGWLTGTPGDATQDLSATITIKPIQAGGVGNWTVYLKWQREVGVTPTDVGPTLNGATKVDTVDIGDGTGFKLVSTGATLTINTTDTAPGGSPAKWRLVAWLAGTSRTHNITGTCQVTA